MRVPRSTVCTYGRGAPLTAHHPPSTRRGTRPHSARTARGSRRGASSARRRRTALRSRSTVHVPGVLPATRGARVRGPHPPDARVRDARRKATAGARRGWCTTTVPGATHGAPSTTARRAAHDPRPATHASGCPTHEAGVGARSRAGPGLGPAHEPGRGRGLQAEHPRAGGHAASDLHWPAPSPGHAPRQAVLPRQAILPPALPPCRSLARHMTKPARSLSGRAGSRCDQCLPRSPRCSW